MNKTDKLNKLFKEWETETQFDRFCKDGIVDELAYEKEDIKILYLLKDANMGDEKENLDVCKYLQKASKGEDKFYNMWRIACMWTGVINGNFKNYSDYTNYKDENLREFLSKIAVINIRKEAGVGINEDKISYDDKLKNAVDTYYDKTEEEINIISPDIVICGGTYDFIKSQYKNRKEIELSSGSNCFRVGNRIFLKMYHPAYRVSPSVLFAYFKEVYSSL